MADATFAVVGIPEQAGCGEEEQVPAAAPQRDLVAMRVEISKMYMKRRPSGSSHVRTRASDSRRFIRCANIAVHSDSEPSSSKTG
jgi:hypothetical protein